MENQLSEYEIWRFVEDIQTPRKTETQNKHHHQISYRFFHPSGKLAETHYDYGRGFYNISVTYIKRISGEKIDRQDIHVYLGTVDDGDFGCWIDVESLEKAEILMEKIINKFKEIGTLPELDKLNEEFRELGVYFYFE